MVTLIHPTAYISPSAVIEEGCGEHKGEGGESRNNINRVNSRPWLCGFSWLSHLPRFNRKRQQHSSKVYED